MWFYTETKSSGRGNMDIDDIKNKYGSKEIKNQNQKKLSWFTHFIKTIIIWTVHFFERFFFGKKKPDFKAWIIKKSNEVFIIPKQHKAVGTLGAMPAYRLP